MMRSKIIVIKNPNSKHGKIDAATHVCNCHPGYQLKGEQKKRGRAKKKGEINTKILFKKLRKQ